MVGEVETEFGRDGFGFAGGIHVGLQHEVSVGAENPGEAGRVEAGNFAGLPAEELAAGHAGGFGRVHAEKTGRIIFSAEAAGGAGFVNVDEGVMNGAIAGEEFDGGDVFVGGVWNGDDEVVVDVFAVGRE